MLRIFLAVILLIAATGLIVAVFFIEEGVRLGDVLINLGTEIVGIALTVAIVDWLMERKALRHEAQSLAWRMLHEVDQAVWVWQGGRREFNLDELVALMKMVDEHDPITEEARGMFINVGSTASDQLRLQKRLLKFEKRIETGSTYLVGLAQLRELSAVPNSFIVESVVRAIETIAPIVDYPINENASSGIARTYRDGTPEGQRQRYRVSYLDPAKRVSAM